MNFRGCAATIDVIQLPAARTRRAPDSRVTCDNNTSGPAIPTEPIDRVRPFAAAGLDPARRLTGVIMTQILPFADARALALYGAFERGVYEAGA